MSTLPVPAAALPAGEEGLQRGHSSRWKARALHLFRSGAVYALGDQVVFSFGNMVVAALLSRHCALVDFGIYILTQRVLDVMIQLSNGFLWTPLTFAWPTLLPARRRPYLGSIVLFQVCFCVLFSAFMWLLARFTAGPAHQSLHGAFGPMVLYGGGILFREFTRRMYFAHMRLREAFWTDVATVGLQIAGTAWLSATGRLTVPSALAALCAGSVVVSFWWLLRERATWQVSLRGSFGDFQQDLSLGRWVTAGNLVALLSAQCNPWFLNGFLGSSFVGTYSICESLVNIPRAALTSLQNVMGPTVARARHEEGVTGVQATVAKMNRILFCAAAGSCIVLSLVSPVVARLIYHFAPGETRSLTTVLALNLVAFAATLAQAYGLMSFGRADRVLYANLFGVGVQASLCFALIHRFQTTGAALALLGGSLGVLLVRHLLYRQAARKEAHPVQDAPLLEACVDPC